MNNLEKLAKILRYAGLNLTPQMLQLMLDPNVRELVDTVATQLAENPELGFDDIDAIIEKINLAAEAQAKEAQKAAEKAAKKKPALEKA